MRPGVAFLALLLAGCSSAVAAAPAPIAPQQQQQQSDTSGPAAGPSRRAQRSGPRPYNRVITSDAITEHGLFTTHRIGDKLFYEIPRSALGKEMLLVSQIAKNTLGAGYGGQAAGDRVLKWERAGDRILLRSISYGITADTTEPIYAAVQDANFAPVVAAFDIEAFGPDSSA